MVYSSLFFLNSVFCAKPNVQKLQAAVDWKMIKKRLYEIMSILQTQVNNNFQREQNFESFVYFVVIS